MVASGDHLAFRDLITKYPLSTDKIRFNLISDFYKKNSTHNNLSMIYKNYKRHSTKGFLSPLFYCHALELLQNARLSRGLVVFDKEIARARDGPSRRVLSLVEEDRSLADALGSGWPGQGRVRV